MSTIHEKLGVLEVAAVVCSALARSGVRAVLSGGAVVSIYSDNAYESKDLDFIVEGIAKKVDPAMEELGFRRQAGRFWTHPRTEFWVEFPSGPLQVGHAPVTEVDEMETPVGLLWLLPPTECVMDRLAAYYHWNDSQSLDQAVAVAARQSVDLDRIRAWSRGEGAGAETRFERFVRTLRRVT